MQTREIPVLPWQIIASDVLEHENQNYLVVIDYYSKYIEAIRLNGKPAVILYGAWIKFSQAIAWFQTVKV